MAEQALVIGGGVAGLAAATELAVSGRKVLLFEKRPRLGGRVESWDDRRVGVRLDCGMHVLLSGYDSTRTYLQRIGAGGGVPFPDRLHIDFRDIRTAGAFTLSTARNPGPKDVLFAMRQLPVPLREKMALLSLSSLAVSHAGQYSRKQDERSAAEWLAARGLGGKIRSLLWDPIIVAAMNGRAEAVSAYLFRRVLEEAFFSGHGRCAIGVSSAPLADVFAEPAARLLQRSGAEIHLGTRVRAIRYGPGDRAAGVVLETGETVEGDAVICAVPPAEMERVLGTEHPRAAEMGGRLKRLIPSPIVTVYLWTDRPLFRRPFYALLSGFSQWVFSAGEDEVGGRKAHRLAVVISAADPLMKEPSTNIAALARDELRRAFPGSDASFLEARVVKRPNATTLFPPGSYELRVPVEPGIPGLFLAGDHVRVGLPATIESAIRTGLAAGAAAVRAMTAR